MAEIDILDFFKTGALSSVRPGVTRKTVEDILGQADDFSYDSINNVSIYERAPFWEYGGVELHFNYPWEGWDDILIQISFKPFYFFRSGFQRTSKVHRWIFRSIKGPKIERLKMGLTKNKIEYQDTWLEWVTWNKELKRDQVIEYQEDLFQEAKRMNSDEEAFGTLVLRNGIQVRYDETGDIIGVAANPDWMIKGKEALITWE